ncbi:hypothetical protein BDK51DRAFT_44405 [Blyttiomyces helicus]|uniref:F-box domain-containing protein n=1 Tax=Blyttiomyces helicus TaxID=388810 RepID=A0A4P9WBY5_9FUNG|nr:hypothetical protein BDK51DRAFT_44405 [Blyttiomyces helicus]|eukprot:RKO90149.1 hypothetical protein BDK51DRAFT_44405 [Blyttiomyces helicus]
MALLTYIHAPQPRHSGAACRSLARLFHLSPFLLLGGRQHSPPRGISSPHPSPPATVAGNSSGSNARNRLAICAETGAGRRQNQVTLYLQLATTRRGARRPTFSLKARRQDAGQAREPFPGSPRETVDVLVKPRGWNTTQSRTLRAPLTPSKARGSSAYCPKRFSPNPGLHHHWEDAEYLADGMDHDLPLELPQVEAAHDPAFEPADDLEGEEVVGLEADLDMDGDREPGDGSTRFFQSILELCSQGFSSVDPSLHTPEVRRAMLACQLGLDCIAALATDTEQRDAAARVELLAADGRQHNHRPRARPRTVIPPLPSEILLRIFGFVNDPSTPPTRVLSTLFSCSLVARSWNRPANAVLWKRVNFADQPSRFGRFVLGAATSKYYKRNCSVLVRVLSVACTDADLSLLSVACHHTTEIHSLELRRTRNQDLMSHRVLRQLPNRFPSLRSFVADMIQPSAWPDIIRICQTCPLLSNLHISFAAGDNPDSVVRPPLEDFEALFSRIPFLQSLSLWRVPLPEDEDALVSPLAFHCRNLRAIRIDDCGTHLTMGLVADIWNCCRQLQCITLRMIRRPPRHYPVHLEPLPTLRTLLVDGCWLSDDFLAAMGRSAPLLETLYVENDWRDIDGEVGSVVHITDASVIALSHHLRSLKTLSLVGLTGPPHLSARSIRAVLARNRTVTALNLARPAHAVVCMGDELLLSIAPCFARVRALELYMQKRSPEIGEK